MDDGERVDGHALHGSFEFGIGVTPAGASEGTVRPGPGGLDLAISLARAVEYTALLLAAGMLVLQRLAEGQPALHHRKRKTVNTPRPYS